MSFALPPVPMPCQSPAPQAETRACGALVFDDGTTIAPGDVRRWLRGGRTIKGKRVVLVFGPQRGPLSVPDTPFNRELLARAMILLTAASLA